jgi:hypothetical protein
MKKKIKESPSGATVISEKIKFKQVRIKWSSISRTTHRMAKPFQKRTRNSS